MGHVCAVEGCYSSRCDKTKKSFHSFPTDEARCRQWIRATGRSDLKRYNIKTLHKNQRICSLHFVPSDFFKSKLIQVAIPSLNLPKRTLNDNQLSIGTQTDVDFVCRLCETTKDSTCNSKELTKCTQTDGDFKCRICGSEVAALASTANKNMTHNQWVQTHENFFTSAKRKRKLHK